MAYSDSDIFSAGYREPGDDCDRLAAYIVLAAGIPAAAGLIGYAAYSILMPAKPWYAYGGWSLALVLGAGMLIWLVRLFVLESRHWNLRHMTADRVIAGLFMFGFALMMIGARFIGPPPGGPGTYDVGGRAFAFCGLFIAGAAVLVVTLFVGLIVAYLPVLLPHRRTYRDAVIVDRFLLDDKAMPRCEEEWTPEETWAPMVKLRTAKGREVTIPALHNVFMIMDLGLAGTARVVNGRITRFIRTAQRR